MRYEPIYEVETMEGFMAVGYICQKYGMWFVCDDDFKYRINKDADRTLVGHKLVGYAE